MIDRKKTTAPVSSVGADGEQPLIKNHNEIIAKETAQINLQANNGLCQEFVGTFLYDFYNRCSLSRLLFFAVFIN